MLVVPPNALDWKEGESPCALAVEGHTCCMEADDRKAME